MKASLRMTGQRLLHYEIAEKLGEGGVGVVYKARDTKLGRTVALKVLPGNFAEDAARMERFQREARALAALNHRNIAAIYGLEESGGVRAIVMELVEGETLARRISRGALPRQCAHWYRAPMTHGMCLPATWPSAMAANRAQRNSI